MSGLQARLNTVFGSLGTDTSQNQASWMPTTQHIFRSGGPAAEHEDSEDDNEYEERLRREVAPGMAMDLVNEDRPDASGFLPSSRFCSAIDREAEVDIADEAAEEQFGQDVRPSLDTEVLEDNVYDQQIASRQALGRPSPLQPIAAVGEDPEEEEEASAMEEDAGTADTAAAAGQSTTPRSTSAANVKSSLRRGGTSRPQGIKKRVSFTGVPEPAKPWVPPHRRPNFVSKVNNQGGPSTSSSWAAHSRGSRGGTAAGIVPDHVANPQRYTRYELEQPLIVGGGLGQLRSEEDGGSGGGQAAVQGAAAMATPQLHPGAVGEEEDAGLVELDRWRAPQGGGGVAFQPRRGKAADGLDGSRAAESAARSSGGGARALNTTFEWEEEGREGEDGSDGMETSQGEDAQPPPQQQQQSRARKLRKIRDIVDDMGDG